MIMSRLFAVLAMLFLAGCAATPQKPAEEAARVRVAAHQQARLDSNYQLAYTFTSPGYRETHPYKFYLGKMGGASIKRRGFEIKRISCQEKVCDVVIDLRYSYAGAAGAKMGKDTVMQRDLPEKWILIDGEWWLVPDR